MATGFVLITTTPGLEHEVRNKLDLVEHVTNRWMLFGEYDLIARVQADDEVTVTRGIVDDIRTISGITNTKTLIGAEI